RAAPTLCYYQNGRAGTTPHSGEFQWRPGLANSATIQAYIQGFKLSHPNIYPISDLLDSVKGPVLWTNSHQISMTQDNSRISEEF
ncbi:hypothetical protein STEG23_016949, partial [Scotinomys teguina]